MMKNSGTLWAVDDWRENQCGARTGPMALIDFTRARRGLSPIEMGLLAFSVAMIVVVTLTL